MTQPWFDPNLYAWIPGTVFGTAAGIMGGLVGWLVPQGKARRGIVRAWIALWISAMVLLAAGLGALSTGQPYGVWFALALPGFIGTLVLGGNLLIILKSYQRIEERRLAARDLL